MTETTATQLAKSLPSVVEVRFKLFDITSFSMINFINECHFLKYFEFKLPYPYNSYKKYKKMNRRLGPEWRSTIDGSGNVKLER